MKQPTAFRFSEINGWTYSSVAIKKGYRVAQPPSAPLHEINFLNFHFRGYLLFAHSFLFKHHTMRAARAALISILNL